MNAPGEILWMGKRQFNRENIELSLLEKWASKFRKIYRIIFAIVLGIVLLLLIVGLFKGETNWASTLIIFSILVGFGFINFFWDVTHIHSPTSSIEYVLTTKGVLFSKKRYGKRKYHFVDYRSVSEIRYNRLRKGEGKIYLIAPMPKRLNIGEHYPTIEVNEKLENIYLGYMKPCWKAAHNIPFK